MEQIKDLNLQTEILPLFDHTLNDFSKSILLNLLQKPLDSKEALIIQQGIFNGFIKNGDTFADYSYSRIDFQEVHRFLSEFPVQINFDKIKWKLRFSSKLRHQTKSKFIQWVLLFHKLYVYYFSKIQLVHFPETYKNELLHLNEFLTGLRLEYYANEINEGRFHLKHIAAFSKRLAAMQSAGQIADFYSRFFLFEAYLSISKGIIRNKFNFPEFSEQSIVLESLFHPLLKNPVKYSFSSQNNVVLITGPNMSGKSVFLKSMALCMHLASLGVAVPASKAVLPVFEHIAVSINHHDDVLGGYSHFMGEIMGLKKLLQAVAGGKKCFAVFDELFKGTNLEDAIEISKATIEGLTHYKGSFFFISTHLHALRQMELVQLKKVDTYFIDCEVVDGKPVFNYQLKAGWSDLRLGQMLFEMEGLHGLLNFKPFQ